MIRLDNVLFYLFVLFCAIGGIFNLIAPKKVIAFRRKFPMGATWVSGGFFYRTESRVRMIGIIFKRVAKF